MKKNVLAIAVLSAVFVALIAIGTFFDLQLSQALFFRGSVFGRVLISFGDAPTYLLTALSALVLYRAVGKTNRFYKWLKPVCALLFFGASYLLCWWFVDAFFVESALNYLYAAILALFFFGAALFATKRIEKVYFDRLLIVAAVFLVSTAVAQGLIELLKYLWTRQAYSTLSVANGYPGNAGYTPWYLPNLGNNDETHLVYDGEQQAFFYRAFPSGHTASYLSLLSLSLVPELFDKAQKYKVFFYAVPAALAFLVGFAGIVSGWEYLTDVVFGAVIGTAAVFATKFLLKILWRKKRFLGYDALGTGEDA